MTLNPRQFADQEAEDVLGALTYLAGGPNRPHHADMDDDALHRHLREDHSFNDQLPTVEQAQRMNPRKEGHGRRNLEMVHKNHHSDLSSGARLVFKIKLHSHG